VRVFCSLPVVSTALFALLLIAAPFHAAAQNLPETADASTAESSKTGRSLAEGGDDQEIDEVVVTVNLSERKEFEIGRSVDIVTTKGIEERNPKSLPDLLDGSTGVHVQKTNAGAGAPFIRGMVGPDNLILIDGVRINNSTFRTGPNQYLALIDPWSIKRLEVLRGPGSVMYGSDALGGVINVITLDARKLDRLLGVGGRLTGASACSGLGGTVQGDLNHDKLSVYLGGTYNHFGEVRSGSGEMQPLSDFMRTSIREKTRVELGDNWSVIEALYWTGIRNAGRTDKLSLGRYRSYDNSDLLSYLRFERRGKGLLHRVRLNASYHHTSEEVLLSRCTTDPDGIVLDRDACLSAGLDTLERKERFDDSVHTPGFFATLESRFWDQRLKMVLGAEGYFEFISSEAESSSAGGGWEWEDKARGNFSDDSRYFSLGTFLKADLDLLKFGKSTVALDGGVRYSYFYATAPDVPGVGDVTYEFSGFVGAAGLRYLFADQVNVYADFSQGFRAPNLQESTVMGDTGVFFEVPNGSLEPVQSNTVEVGMKVQLPAFRVKGAGFTTWLDGMIDREVLSGDEWKALGLTEQDVGSQVVKRRVNAISGTYTGVEAALSSVPFHGFSFWGNVAWIRGEVTDMDGNLEPARRVPPFTGTLGLRYENRQLKLYGEFYTRWATRQSRLSPGDEQDLRICEDPDNPGQLLEDCAGTPGWITYNIRAGYAPLDWLQINAVFENLTDVRYKHFGSGIYSPGFNATCEISMTY